MAKYREGQIFRQRWQSRGRTYTSTAKVRKVVERENDEPRYTLAVMSNGYDIGHCYTMTEGEIDRSIVVEED